MATFNLKKTVTLDGKNTTQLDYDLDALTGADIQQAVKELTQAGIVIGVQELDPNYNAAIFAKAAGLSFHDMALLGAKDYNKATTLVRDFFLSGAEA